MKPRILLNAPRPLLILLIGYFLYAGLFIWRGSYEVGGKRQFLLFDDAMISMRYAKNLVEGNGLVWNPGGERVEGFTNPLWTFLMAASHLLPLPSPLASLPMLLLAAVLLALNIVVVYRITAILSQGDTVAAMIAAFFTAFFFPLNHWGFLGMEVSLLTLLVNTCVLLAIQGLQSGTISPFLYILLGLGTLVRVDAVVPALVILVFLTVTSLRNKQRHIVRSVLCLVIPLAVQTFLRLWYYGDYLPNTYYLKMTGYPALERIAHGLRITFWHMQRLNPFLLLLIAGLFYVRRDRLLFLPAAVFVGQLLYNTYVGGDAWEWWGESNRYVSIAVPTVFILFSMSVTVFANIIQERFQLTVLQQRRFLMPVVGIVLVAAFFIVNKRDDWDLIREVFLLKGPVHMLEHRQALESAAMLDTVLTRNGTVAVVWAGVVPYFLERRAIDMLGKTDKHVARLPATGTNPPPLLESFYPGHMKYDYDYSVGTLRPDIVLRLWMVQGGLPAVVKEMYWRVEIGEQRFFARKDSKNIRWEGIRCAICKSDPRKMGHEH